ncbi:bifunctional nuclease family protein [Candidatus Bipolaricaulota bacterium]|nr:bifunctional nuclease family protein [Candidatus Bipolaricaulota bacterium]
MKEAEVKALLVDPINNSPVILLKDRNSSKAMPIWIGEAEAMSIALELQGQTFPRPLSHDLMKRLLEALGGTLERVVISGLKEGTFYATLYVRTSTGEVKEIDARPSDSVALALRTRSPIYIADEVFEQSAIESPFAEEERFHEFVDRELKLSEFRKRAQSS